MGKNGKASNEWAVIESALATIKARDLHGKEALEASAEMGLKVARLNARLTEERDQYLTAICEWVTANSFYTVEQCEGWISEETRDRLIRAEMTFKNLAGTFVSS